MVSYPIRLVEGAHDARGHDDVGGTGIDLGKGIPGLWEKVLRPSKYTFMAWSSKFDDQAVGAEEVREHLKLVPFLSFTICREAEDV